MTEKCKCNSNVDISVWSQRVSYKKRGTLEDLLSNPEDVQWPFDSKAEVVLMTAKANQIRECTFCRQILIERLRMPQFWWSDTYKRMNGYFGSECVRNTEGGIGSCSTWSRTLVKHFAAPPIPAVTPDIHYRWLKFNLFTRWIESGRMVIVAFDPVDIVREGLCESLLQNISQDELQDPFWPYIRILEELVSLQGTSIWSLRNLIRTTELSPTRDHRNLRNKPKYNYSRLHDIARHAIHVSETLDLSVKLSESIMREHEQLMASISDFESRLTSEKTQLFKRAYFNTRSRLTFFSHALFSLRCRSTSNHQRLHNEIQLRFHTDSQYDSQASVEINYSTKSDSTSMRWIAIVSLVFLPANLVSSVFSTTFFNTANGVITVTTDFWIYWVVLVVVTAATMAFWFYLPRLSSEADTRSNHSTASYGEEKPLRSFMHGVRKENTNLDLSTSYV
ncbi:hypothetical protein F4804DRAFT_289169 [Jackrogersella minutella]|nr:hypothetical protein F4804DRAFT_289169 [Jackrogersella minutella]